MHDGTLLTIKESKYLYILQNQREDIRRSLVHRDTVEGVSTKPKK